MIEYSSIFVKGMNSVMTYEAILNQLGYTPNEALSVQLDRIVV